MNSYMVYPAKRRLKVKTKSVAANNKKKYYKQPWLVLCFLLPIISCLAQQQCGDYANYLYKVKTIPGYEKMYLENEQKIKEQMQLKMGLNKVAEEEILTIPVVFHIVWKEPWEKFTEDLVKIQLAQLNNDYNNLNYDLRYVPAAFQPLVGNMRIRFVLAQTDDENRPTNGIIYKQTTAGWNDVFSDGVGPLDDYMKFEHKGGSNPLDVHQYLNIWICDAGAINGYAEFPSGGIDNLRDGVVVHSRAFGVHFNNRPGYNFGRTLVHEVGHWLGLKHIWGDDDWAVNSGAFCNEDDGIEDTPKQPKRTFGTHRYNFHVDDCAKTNAGSMWMNYMDYADHLNRLMFSKGQVAKARTILTTARASLLDSKGLKPSQFNTGNVAAFRTQAFSAVGVGKDGHIWAGTNLFGLYNYDGTNWLEVTALANRDIRQIVSDKFGGIWIAQMGHEGSRGIGGGINYFPRSNAADFTYFTSSIGLPSRLPRGIYVDTSQPANGFNVWTANIPERNFAIVDSEVVSVYKGGAVGYKSHLESFQTVSEGLNPSPIAPNTFVCKAIGGGSNEVWVFDDAVANQQKIVRYNAATKALLAPSYDASNTSNVLPAGFFVNSIHFDGFGNKWVGLESGGIAYANSSNTWQKLALPAEVLSDAAVNAIVSDKEGNIFIGTSQGLVVLNQSMIGTTASYKLLRIEENLPSDNVTALAVDELRKAIIIGTDNGICLLQKNCILSSCQVPAPIIAYSIKNGNWDDQTLWSEGIVPTCGTIVVIQHHVKVNSRSNTGPLNLIEGSLVVEAGVQLILCPGNN